MHFVFQLPIALYACVDTFGSTIPQLYILIYIYANPVQTLGRPSMMIMVARCYIVWLVGVFLSLMTITTTTATSVVVHPDLPLGDINLIVVTDEHSWCGGQKKLYGEAVAANGGDVLSFVQRLKQYVEEADEERDVWFVMNGDFIDGTGLSMNRNVDALIPILQRMKYDAINVGNHELYSDHFIAQISSPGGFIEWYGDRYISSNVQFSTNMTSSTTQHQQKKAAQPIGNYYYMLKGKHYNVLTFGFLYNMQNYALSVKVVEVETIVQESWFVDVLKKSDEYDAILVLAHMDVRDPLCQIILDAIRTITGDSNVPVQFITGHTHIRDYNVFETLSTSFEAGHFLDTLGFVSFPTRQTVLAFQTQQTVNDTTTNGTTTNSANSSVTSLFKYKYINTTIDVFASTLGLTMDSFPTNDGMEQSHFIKRIQEDLGLNEVIGCIDDTYYLNRSLAAHDSLWGHFRDYVVPSRFIGKEVLFLGSGGWRFDLFKGSVSIDDVYGISPFNNTFWAWNDIPAQVISLLNNTLNALPPQVPTALPNYVLAPARASFYGSDDNFTLVVDSFSVEMMEYTLRNIIIPKYGDSVPERNELSSELTTTTIWMDYFQQSSHKCQNAKQISSTKHINGKPSSTHNSDNEHSGDESSSDTIRLSFVAISICTVIVFASIVVHQKSKIFQFIREQRDRATMEAIREYEERERDYDEEYSDEGEFT